MLGQVVDHPRRQPRRERHGTRALGALERVGYLVPGLARRMFTLAPTPLRSRREHEVAQDVQAFGPDIAGSGSSPRLATHNDASIGATTRVPGFGGEHGRSGLTKLDLAAPRKGSNLGAADN